MTDYPQTMALFAIFLFGIIIIPGTDMMYVLGSSLAGGVRRGSWALGGVVAGGAIHTLVAAVGLGAIIATFPAALEIILVAGGAYMAWIGSRMWRHAPEARIEAATDVPRSRRRTALTGLATCLLNPKAYLFMFAVLPGFIRSDFGPLWRQFLVFGAMICAMQALVYGVVLLMGGGLGRTLAARPELLVNVQRAMGLALIAFAAWAVAEGFLRGLS